MSMHALLPRVSLLLALGLSGFAGPRYLAGGEASESPVDSPRDGVDVFPLLEAHECARWDSTALSGSDGNAFFLSGPRSGEDRGVWLDRALRYRKALREGDPRRVLRIDYDGVRAWTRLDFAAARAFDPRPGETLRVRVEGRSIDGNPKLCVAFDRHDRVTGAKLGWTEVQVEIPVPGGDGGGAEAQVRIPVFDAERSWLRPIFGLDGTRDPEKGSMELRSLRLSIDDVPRLAALARASAASPRGALSLGIYDRDELRWVTGAFTCHFTFVYDRSFYDPESGRYRVDEFLADGERRFGGYDCLLLWQGYPRLGVDPRNQFDIYRDLPGGVVGLRELSRTLHARGVKLFIDYNPWDTATRREAASDEEILARLLADMEADGIFLDTMSAGSRELRDRVDAARPGVAFSPEGHPAIEQLGICSSSWAQWVPDPAPPGILRLKWIEPRHMQYQIRRWDRTHAVECETAFFNGSGMLVWENVFGAWNSWRPEDASIWRRASRILRFFDEELRGDAWDPHVPTLASGLFANRWPGKGRELFILLNYGAALRDAPLLELPSGGKCFDLWNGKPIALEPGTRAGSVRIRADIDRLGAVVVFEGDPPPALEGLLAAARGDVEAEVRAKAGSSSAADRPTLSVIEPRPVERTIAVAAASPPPGMVLVPGGRVSLRVEHMRRECGCYPDPGTPPEREVDFLWGDPHAGRIQHVLGPLDVTHYFIDEAEVSNADFQRFLDGTGYRPRHPERFLDHWPGGRLPVELRDHPVVYVDLEDARAYARWAGKRLPTEAEWQLAAQGTDGRAWPWGPDFDPRRCNTNRTGTLPVRSLPEGKSPSGAYHMSGNVWEWTESERDDGHTRFALIRGGGWYDADTSIWYVRGGPRRVDEHAKFLLLWPGLDRCPTVGFRCVVDAR